MAVEDSVGDGKTMQHSKGIAGQSSLVKDNAER